MNIIGKTICESRRSKGLTQEELAEMSNVNLRTIQRIENNESEPRGKTLNLICEVLEIKIEDVLNKEKQNSEIIIDPNLVHGYKLASKGIRLLASLTEFIILFTVIGIPMVVYFIFSKNFILNDFQSVNIEYLTVSSLMMGAVLYPIFTGNLGHKIFNLKVISSQSGSDYNKAADGAIREFLKCMLGYLIIPTIWIIWDEKNQNLYDKLTKTYVVEKK